VRNVEFPSIRGAIAQSRRIWRAKTSRILARGRRASDSSDAGRPRPAGLGGRPRGAWSLECVHHATTFTIRRDLKLHNQTCWM